MVNQRRISWLANLRMWLGKTSAELSLIAINKIKIAMLIANVQNGYALKEEDDASAGRWYYLRRSAVIIHINAFSIIARVCV